jgi:O-acetylhomoserine/O-acetylserine sulfhydrylase-like pyridoxal-dependent enzyme
MTDQSQQFELARDLSPRRHTTSASDIAGLVDEQLTHFGIDKSTPYGTHLANFASHLYSANADLKQLWEQGAKELANLPRQERIERFSSQRFLSFQLAKILDTLQHPSRTTYQSIVTEPSDRARKGPYPIFDNITALFSSKPVITRTATYIYACAEWVEDAFQGREMLHEIYSRLLNPTSISLANHIVDIECGDETANYMAWNFNSGMAAVDAILSHLCGYQDIILASRNVYGGVYQLLEDWYGKQSNLDIAIEFFDGYSEQDFIDAYNKAAEKHKDRLAQGRQIYVYIESPCNPHGLILDTPAISRAAHERDLEVICDSTVGTPFLHRPLQNPNLIERPDFIIHSYTKDISGHGATTAGCVIGRNERMFMPKNTSADITTPSGKQRTIEWNDTLFWNVYYIKGAFLDSEKAYEVINGLHTLDQRMLTKAINTLTLAEVLGKHPHINVNSNACTNHHNHAMLEKCMHLALPAPLFTFDFEAQDDTDPLDQGHFSRLCFQKFFDQLDPVFGHQVSLGTPNTIILCPAITSHSEMSKEALKEAGIAPTCIRLSVGLEDPRTLLAHLIRSAQSTLDSEVPNFSSHFPTADEIDAIYKKHYLDVHKRYVESTPSLNQYIN